MPLGGIQNFLVDFDDNDNPKVPRHPGIFVEQRRKYSAFPRTETKA
ncbi:hypothetical protein C900_03431 [Fulvivirga imtechensis AK7]|uniref:Uncharacterized protein n=1 Tax=Fulvivirga imtechensis AK7 TaxID=1237149 RepID=L8JRL7_9BACT|nr:hypothetical protein C900_03431 [Fulvivirga imtechensis AK7]